MPKNNGSISSKWSHKITVNRKLYAQQPIFKKRINQSIFRQHKRDYSPLTDFSKEISEYYTIQRRKMNSGKSWDEKRNDELSELQIYRKIW